MCPLGFKLKLDAWNPGTEKHVSSDLACQDLARLVTVAVPLAFGAGYLIYLQSTVLA